MGDVKNDGDSVLQEMDKIMREEVYEDELEVTVKHENKDESEYEVRQKNEDKKVKMAKAGTILKNGKKQKGEKHGEGEPDNLDDKENSKNLNNDKKIEGESALREVRSEGQLAQDDVEEQNKRKKKNGELHRVCIKDGKVKELVKLKKKLGKVDGGIEALLIKKAHLLRLIKILEDMNCALTEKVKEVKHLILTEEGRQ